EPDSLTLKTLSPMQLVKRPAVLLAIVVASFLFIFAAKKNPSEGKRVVVSAEKKVTTENNAALFSELHLTEAGMNQAVFNSALQGLKKLDSTGVISKDSIITIIDFSQPSDKKRL